MTIPEYVCAALAAAKAAGLRREDLVAGGICNPSAHASGQVSPGLKTLARYEALCGLSLDALDPRVRRGMALAEQVPGAAAEHGWAAYNLGNLLGMSEEAARSLMRTGRLNDRATARQAMRLCDVMEGRLAPKARPMYAAMRQALAPSGDGGGERQLAAEVFGRAINPLVEEFRLRQAAPGRWRADGPTIRYDILLEPGCATLVATVRRSGIEMMRRQIPIAEGAAG